MERKMCVAGCIFVLFSGRAWAFKPEIHVNMCQEILPSIERTVDGKKISFAEKPIVEIREANHATDSGNSYTNAMLKPTWHFDNELLNESSDRLIKLKGEIISNITASSPNGHKARELLGGALHTLQDFYAHTNWANIIPTHSDINFFLGKERLDNPKLGAVFCPYNSAELNGLGVKELTSGYFVGLGCGSPSAGKCIHGSKHLGVDLCLCINKDDSNQPFYTIAYPLGKSATTDYLNQIFNAPGVVGNAKAIESLMGINGTLGMVIDDTGSMSDDIYEVQAKVIAVAQ